MCKAEWYTDKADVENAERADDESIELVVSNYSCSSALDMRGFDNAYHHYTLVVSARLNTVASRRQRYKALLQAEATRPQRQQPRCDVRCQLKNVAGHIINDSRPIIDQSVGLTSFYARQQELL